MKKGMVQAGPKLGQLLVSPDWRCRHAALICLAQIAEGCAKVLSGQLKGLVDMCEKVCCLIVTAVSGAVSERRGADACWAVTCCADQAITDLAAACCTHWVMLRVRC